MWSSLKNYTDPALLFARVVLGLLLLCFHAWPRLAATIPLWHHHHSFWGALLITVIAVAETAASIFLILGLWARIGCLVFIILVGQLVFHELVGRGSIAHAESNIELFLLLIVLFFAGPGRFSFDKA